MNDQTTQSISIHDIREAILEHILNEFGWGEKVVIENHKMEPSVARYIINSALLYVSKILRIGSGIALIKDQDDIQEDNVTDALSILEEGLDC